MGYFPFFIDISGRRCVVIGGGRVALRKIQKLAPYGPDITVVAPEIAEEIIPLVTKAVRREFEESDLDGAFMAIAAANDRALDRRIYELCTRRGMLINSVDDIESCGFVFPALVTRGNISIGISTSGTAPAFAKHLRREIEALLDDRTLAAAELSARVRPMLKKYFDTERLRARAADELLRLCSEGGGLLSDEAVRELFERIKRDEDQDRNTRQQACDDTD